MRLEISVTTLAANNVLILDGERVITGRGTVLDAPAVGSRTEMLERLASRYGDGGLVLVTGETWATFLQLQDRAWSVLPFGRQFLRFGNLAKIDRSNDPMVTDDLMGTALMHQWFHNLTGVPFYGDGGTTSCLLMDATISVRGQDVLRKQGERATQLMPRVIESPWPGPWGPKDASGFTIDRNAQYLAAAGGAILPMDGLQRDPGFGGIGYHKITVPENPEPRLPHPCGPGAEAGDRRWVATPTLELLRAIPVGVTVHDEWTCPRSRCRRLLSGAGQGGTGKWYERLREARRSLLSDPHQSPESRLVLAAVKATYTRGIGAALVRDTGRWHRPDWAAIIQAKARCDMWRQLQTIGTTQGLWPVATRTDAVTYAHNQLPLVRLGDGIGEWSVVA